MVRQPFAEAETRRGHRLQRQDHYCDTTLRDGSPGGLQSRSPLHSLQLHRHRGRSRHPHHSRPDLAQLPAGAHGRGGMRLRLHGGLLPRRRPAPYSRPAVCRRHILKSDARPPRLSRHGRELYERQEVILRHASRRGLRPCQRRRQGRSLHAPEHPRTQIHLLPAHRCGLQGAHFGDPSRRHAPHAQRARGGSAVHRPLQCL